MILLVDQRADFAKRWGCPEQVIEQGTCNSCKADAYCITDAVTVQGWYGEESYRVPLCYDCLSSDAPIDTLSAEQDFLNRLCP